MGARTFLGALGLIFSGCATLPHPTAMDESWAQARWPGTSLASLEEARGTYARKCSGCHNLHLPQQRTPEEWPREVEEMAGKAHLNDFEREQITRFLVTMSSRGAETQSP
jgi:hypothetical protein